MSETDPGTEAFASPVTGWVVGTSSLTIYSMFDSQVETSTQVTPVPTLGTPNITTGDCLRTTNTYTGSFASGNWEVHLCCRANTFAGGQNIAIRFMLLRGANANGSGATAIGGTRTALISTGILSTTATGDSNLTFNPGAFSVSNEYIFVQFYIEKMALSSMSTGDANIRIGNASGFGTRVISADFTATAAPALPDIIQQPLIPAWSHE